MFVDAHEMGPNSTFFFDPSTDPYNPHTLPAAKRLAHEDRPHARGALRSPRLRLHDARDVRRLRPAVRLDLADPAWLHRHPLGTGRRARSRHLARQDQTKLHYHDGVRHHYVSGLATLEAAAKNRQQLLRRFSQELRRQRQARRRPARSARSSCSKANVRPRRRPRASCSLHNGIEVHRRHRSDQERRDGHAHRKGARSCTRSRPAATLCRSTNPRRAWRSRCSNGIRTWGPTTSNGRRIASSVACPTRSTIRPRGRCRSRSTSPA